MRKSMLMAALAAVSIFAVACGGGNGNGGNSATGNSGGNGAACTGDTGGDACTGDTGGETGDTGDACSGGDTGGESSSTDAYALYKKEGRSWMYKTTTKMSGTENVSYMKYEVKTVADDHAVVVMTMLDKDKKPNEYVKPTEQKIDFAPAATDTGGDAPAVDTTEETVSAAGQDWVCIKVEMDNNGTKTTSWSSKEYPGLSVKSVSKSESMESTMELVEFNDG